MTIDYNIKIAFKSDSSADLTASGTITITENNTEKTYNATMHGTLTKNNN